MATQNKPPELQFMVKTSMNGFNTADRKLIRSHVMKGKNLGRMRPLGSRRYLESINSQENAASSSSSVDVSNYNGSHDSDSISRSISNSLQYYECQTGSQTQESIPPLVGSAASTMYLADSVEPTMVEVVIRLSSIAKQLLFPIEKCIFFDRRAENWIAPLAVDSAFLHAKVFTSLYYFDVVLPKRPSHDSKHILYHYHKTVSLLRRRLLFDDDEIRLSNNTVSVILTLASQAFSTGDLKLALHHMRGIRRIIDLRGGLSTFKGNEKLAAETLRCDLGTAVHSGLNPLLLRDVAPSDTYRMYPKLSVFLDEINLARSSKSLILLNSSATACGIEVDGKLASAWSAMSDFCCVINLAAKSRQRITVETFLHSMASIMYNLLDMHFEASSWDETVRLGLLSFSCSVFLPWSHLGMSLPHLNMTLREQFTRLITNIPSLPPNLVIWPLMAGAVTISRESDSDWLYELLRDAASLYEIKCWGQMRNMLMPLMWIGIVHDKLGKCVFDRAIGCSYT
ncbi:hypothetical protein GGR58DRAFT_525495 [Xylaria digitata]|nr:hypothetical protein GGR58DRAFT_525495 [Xylaria digitata]